MVLNFKHVWFSTFQPYPVLGWYDDEPQWRRLQEGVEMCSPFSQRSSYPTKYPDFPKMIKLSPNFQLHTSYSPIFLGFFFSFPTPGGCIVTQLPFTASSPRGPRMLSLCRWRPRLRLGGAWKRSCLALMGLNNQQLGRETIIIGLLYIYINYIIIINNNNYYYYI